jgi:DNA polymerase III epsilon subunit-like protein
MKLLFFDTETTGLPKNREPAYKGPGNWPHMVSISWVLQDGHIIRERKSFIVKPEWEIPDDSIRVHGITFDRATQFGFHLRDIMNQFLAIEHDYLICHNAEFDINVLVNACLWDLKIPLPRFGRQFCTMRMSADLLRLPMGNGRSGYKNPKLGELYEHVIKKKPVQELLHSSMYDTDLLVEIVNNYRPFKAILGLLGPDAVEANEASERTRTIIL